MPSKTLSAAPLALLVCAALPAQNPFHGNGVPSAYVENTAAVLGGNLVLRFGSPTTPLPLAILSMSDGYGPVFIPDPLFGNVALNVLSPAYLALGFGLDPAGDGVLTIPIPPGFQPASAPPLFLNVMTLEPPLLSISKTVRFDWANANGWEPVASLGTPRQLHTATPLGSGPRDNVTEVLITGGALGSFIVPLPLSTAELFSPLTRSTTPLPNLAMARAGHRAVRLLDGRILITGGATTSGVVTNTCEVFVPATQTFVPGPAMNTSRSGHAITLLANGRVLVTGGVANWQNAATAFIAVLNTAQNSAEVFDPIANTWTPVQNMASKRLGHSQTRLLDGRVLITSGIHGGYSGANLAGGGQIPQYTSSCELFDPASNTFAATGPLTTSNYIGRAFHGASLLPSGDVLVTGGFVAAPATAMTNDETFVADFCNVWSVTTGAWSIVPSLPAAAAFHGQVPHGNGAIVCGGISNPLTALTPTAVTAFHDGATVTALRSIGLDGPSGIPQARGTHSFTPLYDGTFLVYGGGVWPSTLADGWIYTP